MANISNSSDSENDQLKITPFPYKVFPKIIQEIIEVYCSDLNLNIDYSAASILFAFSAAMGSHFLINIKNGWSELGLVFIALVGKPGINKSAPISVFTKPLEERDKKLFDDYIKEFKDYKQHGQNGREKNDIYLNPPIRKQLVIKDATQEALLKGLYENKHGFAGIYDELGSFLKSFNKYKSGGGDEELMLSLYSGKSISVNRKSEAPFLIEKPFFSIIGSIQPQVLISLMGNNRIDNGLTHRFLFAYPDQVLRTDLSQNEIQGNIAENYRDLIGNILTNQMLEGSASVRKLSLSKGAFDYYTVFRRRINDIINNERSEAISGIYAKLDTYFLRISLIVHIMRVACNEPNISNQEISVSSLEKADEIIKYFEHTALKVFKLLEKHRDPLTEYPMEHKILYYKLPFQFTTKQAWDLAKLSVSRRTMFNMLNDDYLFFKRKHGEYEKIW